MLNIQNPNEAVGKIVKVVYENKLIVEDVVMSVDTSTHNVVCMNLSKGRITFCETEK